MKNAPLSIVLLLLISNTYIFCQSKEAKCRSFYDAYGYHLIDFGDKKQGLAYLLKNEILDDNKYKYGKIVATAIELDKDITFIFEYMQKLCFTIGEDVSLEDIMEYPTIAASIKDNKYENVVDVMCKNARLEVRNILNFAYYNKLKSSIYIDQDLIRRKKTRFTDSIDWLIKMDTLNIESLRTFFENNTLPEKGTYTLGSPKDRFFIMLLHNSRYPYPKTYKTVMELGKKLVELGYLNYHSLLLFHDAHLVNQGLKQTYGKAMPRWEGDDKIVFSSFENIEKLDSIRVSNSLLPFQFEMQAIGFRDKKRKVVPPVGYVFDENWRTFCDCELLDSVILNLQRRD